MDIPKPQKKTRPAPKKWSLYRSGELKQESDNWEELYAAAQYWIQKGASCWLIKNGSVAL